MSWFSFHFPDFALSFLSIIFEGIPFLLLGSLVSGAVEAFVPRESITRWLPKNYAAAIMVSALMGLVLPMCECASVVVIRRLIRKGLPLSCAITYMMARADRQPGRGVEHLCRVPRAESGRDDAPAAGARLPDRRRRRDGGAGHPGGEAAPAGDARLAAGTAADRPEHGGGRAMTRRPTWRTTGVRGKLFRTVQSATVGFPGRDVFLRRRRGDRLDVQYGGEPEPAGRRWRPIRRSR